MASTAPVDMDGAKRGDRGFGEDTEEHRVRIEMLARHGPSGEPHDAVTHRGANRGDDEMTTKTEKTKPAKRPTGLMDLHLRLVDKETDEPTLGKLLIFADAVVRACDDSAVSMRARIFKAVEALRDA